MIHRHLNHQELSLAAIDDLISRGKRKDWEELRLAVLASPGFLQRIQQVCRSHIADPRAQRYHFWMHYAEAHLAASLQESCPWMAGLEDGQGRL